MADQKVIVQRREAKFENSKWTVCADAIAGPGGLCVPDYLVIIPKARAENNVGGVCVLPVLASGEVLLLRNYRHPLETSFWECARGFVDVGETPADAAARELMEETGLATPRLAPLGLVAPEPSTIVARIALYAALDCRVAGTQAQDELGLGSPQAFAWDDVFRMANDGEIQDSATLLAIYRYAASRA